MAKVHVLMVHDDRTIREMLLPLANGRLRGPGGEWDIEPQDIRWQKGRAVVIVSTRSAHPPLLERNGNGKAVWKYRAPAPEKVLATVVEASHRGAEMSQRMDAQARLILTLATGGTALAVALAAIALIMYLPHLRGG